MLEQYAPKAQELVGFFAARWRDSDFEKLTEIISDIELQIKLAMKRDQFLLRRQFKTAKQLAGKTGETKFEKFKQSLSDSIELRQIRKDRLPHPSLDQGLPIFAQAEEIKQAIQDHQVVVLSGETGSGKSTQLPLICLQAGFGVGGFIGHTQPRRIAARSVASRIAFQMKCKLGNEVGFKIRFSDQSGSRTYVKLMTDGVLLAETLSDRFMDQYEVIIIDEAHERSLNIDFLLGYIKGLLLKRRDLRLIITSATIDTGRFADHFTIDPLKPVPIIHVEGRAYPVDIQYRPPGINAAGAAIEQSAEDAVIDAVLELASRDRGDMLVFLPTEHDIRTTAKKLRARHFHGDGSAKTEILPLYARLSNEQQNVIFQSGKHRRIVLATNVAESSITVPGIRYVVDTGTARISRYAPRSKVQRLPIEAISQASASQRAGRCGRIGPGVCLRLYSEEDFLSRAAFTTPEIRRTNLASVILQTKALKLGAIDDFPFIDPPRPEAIRDGYKTLVEIGAVDDVRNLTPLGRKLSRLPVDPRIGRMLFAASENNCLAEVLIIAAALEVQDPRVRPAENQKAADESHRRFHHEQSDFLAWLKLWKFFHHLRDKLSRSKFRKACQENFLSFVQIQQWSDVHRQLREMAKSAGLHYASRDFAKPENYQAIHESLVTGLLSGVAMLSDKHNYTGAGGVKFDLWPGSGLFSKKPKWVIVSEIVETAKCYGRTVAKITPEWIEPLAEHITKQNYIDPHWSRKRETTLAYENVSLFGLPIIVRRPVAYSKIDPDLSRKLFIEKGLAAVELRRIPDFLQHNIEVRKNVAELAAKTRQRELVIDEIVIEDFYDSRLPQEAVDLRQLERLLKRDKLLGSRLLMTPADLIGEQDDGNNDEQYPDTASIGNLDLPIKYRFSPGEPDDGATLEVPLEAAAQLDQHQLGWLVPGLIGDRVEALIRSLPKSVRRKLIPAPETAREVCERLEPSDSFEAAVAKQLSLLARETVLPSMFDATKIEDKLKLNLRLLDEGGEVIAQSRSLDEVIRALPEDQKRREIVIEDTTWQQDGLAEWTWGDLPESISIRRGVSDVPVFPAIVDQTDAVGLRVFDQRQHAEAETRRGLTRLFRIKNRRLVRSQINWLPELDRLCVLAGPLFSNKDQFKDALGDLIVRIGFVEGKQVHRSRQEFEKAMTASAEYIGVATQDVAVWLPKMLEAYQAVRLALQKHSGGNAEAVADMRHQLTHIFVDEFLIKTPWRWLKHFPRYLNGIVCRFDRLGSGTQARDRQQTLEISEVWSRYQALENQLRELGRSSEELVHARWMIEEYRVSLFAQQLGTSEKVSRKRIEKQLDAAK